MSNQGNVSWCLQLTLFPRSSSRRQFQGKIFLINPCYDPYLKHIVLSVYQCNSLLFSKQHFQMGRLIWQIREIANTVSCENEGRALSLRGVLKVLHPTCTNVCHQSAWDIMVTHSHAMQYLLLSLYIMLCINCREVQKNGDSREQKSPSQSFITKSTLKLRRLLLSHLLIWLSTQASQLRRFQDPWIYCCLHQFFSIQNVMQSGLYK